MLRLLPLPIFICIYLFSWWRCKKNIIASDKQLKPCIDWAYIKNLPLPPKPSFVEFYIVNQTLTTFTAGKLRLGYPESITSEEILF